MTAQRIHWRGAILLCILSGVFMACESVDTGVESTLDSDYTIILQVMEQSVHVGDQTPLVLKLKRTDNSNLPNGMQGSIVITTSAHGGVDASAVPIEVGNDRTHRPDPRGRRGSRDVPGCDGAGQGLHFEREHLRHNRPGEVGGSWYAQSNRLDDRDGATGLRSPSGDRV